MPDSRLALSSWDRSTRMKIKNAALPAEADEVEEIVAALLEKKIGMRLHKKDAHPPFKHIYLTTRQARKADNHAENA